MPGSDAECTDSLRIAYLPENHAISRESKGKNAYNFEEAAKLAVKEVYTVHDCPAPKLATLRHDLDMALEMLSVVAATWARTTKTKA